MGRQVEVVVHASFTVDTCTNDIDEASKRAKLLLPRCWKTRRNQQGMTIFRSYGNRNSTTTPTTVAGTMIFGRNKWK